MLSYEDLLQKYFEQSQSLNKGYSPFDHAKYAVDWVNNSPVRDLEWMKKRQEDGFIEYNKRIGVLSLTEYNNLSEMWEMYSDNHEGFCVGFEPKNMLRGTSTAGGKVNYFDELPIIYPSPKHSFSKQSILQVFSKERKWEFEQEYRVYKFKEIPLTNNDRVEIVNPNAFKELIFGAAMPENIINDIINSLPIDLSHLKKNLKFAKIVNGKIEIID